nr:heme-binding protein [Candidatus Brachybacter algidus]
MAAIQFGGFANDDEIKKYASKLEEALKRSGINYYGNFRFLGYNAPFQLLARRNEIVVMSNGINKLDLKAAFLLFILI